MQISINKKLLYCFQASIQARLLYDAIYLYGVALNKTLEKNFTAYRNGRLIKKYTDTTFEG